MEALNDVVRSGKVRYIGASSMWAWQFAKAQQIARENNWSRFISMQNHYNLAYREEEREMIPLCKDQGIGLIPWSPLARGFLAGNRKPDDRDASKNNSATSRAKTDEMALRVFYTEADFDVVNALTKVAGQRDFPTHRLLMHGCFTRESPLRLSAHRNCINWMKPFRQRRSNYPKTKWPNWKNLTSRIPCLDTVRLMVKKEV